MGWLRVLVLLFAALTIAYVAVWFKAQKRQRAKLKAEYVKSKNAMTEKDFVSVGLEKYNRGLKPKLLLFVYAVPFVVALFLLYLANI